MLESSDHYSFRLSSDESLRGTFSSTTSSSFSMVGKGSSSCSSSKLKIDQMFHESRALKRGEAVPKVHQIKMKLQTQRDSSNSSSSASRDIPNRDTTFSEARSAVQKQIQKMFDSSSVPAGSQFSSRELLLFGGKGQEGPGSGGGAIKHTSHGVSHAFLSSTEPLVNPPPPIHYGVSDAIRSKRSGSTDSSLVREPPSPTTSLRPPSDSNRAPPPLAEKKKEFVKHKVDYLGALPVPSKSTSLGSLQKPLKDLYFKYRAMHNLGQTNLPGTLEINANGLVVQYIRELHKGVQEIFNPFSTIAVWAAVRFTHKRDVVRGSGSVRHSFAFLPLISDPEGKDKASLFNDIEDQEVELASDAPHPPLFACVMRRNGAPKQLECHGFVCSESEDAIVIAANLYQALLKTMKKKSSSVKDNGLTSNNKQPQQPTSEPQESPPNNLPPTRPPRRRKRDTKRSSIRSSGSNRRSMKRMGKGRRSTKLSQRTSLDRRSSRRKAPTTNMMMSNSDTGKGDVYTRVAIPRSKSFMNVTSQYNLQELFRELKEKEGVESIDDVLKKILSPDGISFNEIKPVYRELLLKLAMTMTQDEIFQRSKNIISQKKSRQTKNTRSSKASNTPKNDGILGSLFTKKSSKSSSSADECSALTVSNIKVITKADISNPIPISGKYSNSSTQTRPVKSAPLPPVPVLPKVDDEAYSCCGGCGTDYETVDYGSDCSCIHDHKSSSSNASVSSTIISCNCDYSSCDSNDKCYCTLSRSGGDSAAGSLRMEKRNPHLFGGGYDSSYSKTGFSSTSSSCCCSCYYSSSGGSSISSHPSPKKCISPNKVLMVSAVDTKGNVVYQGGAPLDKHPNKPLSTSTANSKISIKDPPSRRGDKASVISLKKSAEIAAVFSGAKINQTTDIFNEEDSTDDAYDSMRNSSSPANNFQEVRRPRSTCHAHQFSEANLKHSLGYFP